MKSLKLCAVAAFAATALLMGAHPEGRASAKGWAVPEGSAFDSQEAQQQAPPSQQGESFRFRTGIELINVTATVTDENGRFVSGLRKEDFRVYQDNQPQPISHFSAERVPVSLGIVLDTSGSMDGEKMSAARSALSRFLFQLLDPSDEVFLYRFDSNPELVHGWTTDRRRIGDELNRIQPRGGTAMYDAVAEAVPLAQSGRNRKKAILLISDGNDTSSRIDVRSLKQLIRETEVLVYAIGIDGQTEPVYMPAGIGQGGIQRPRPQPPRIPIPSPFPIPGGPRRLPPPKTPTFPPTLPRGGNNRTPGGGRDGVNVTALRDITDDSGGRTEIVWTARDLDPTTAGIADELSRQYYLGYASTGVKDGRWHTIRVELRNANYHVRARQGFIATP